SLLVIGFVFMLHFSEGKNIVSHCESFQNRILTPLGCTLHAKPLFRTVSTLNTLAMHELRSEQVERLRRLQLPRRRIVVLRPKYRPVLVRRDSVPHHPRRAD